MFAKPEWLTYVSSWHGHMPFACFLISAIKPRTFIELGVHFGDSYCAFCQTVKALGLDTTCKGIDNWQGDEHAGNYKPEDILPTLREHHDIRYSNFSTLWQSSFDDALPQVPDKSIDLLHIDGFHTYEAVRHDFETWLPKMSERGIMLLHDTTVRERNFGVYRWWEEISARYPHFEFRHSHGLGLLGVGSELPPALLPFFQATPEESETLRTFFNVLGDRVFQEGQQMHREQSQQAEFNRVLKEKPAPLDLA
jgi:O-antigen biosynthesis protein